MDFTRRARRGAPWPAALAAARGGAETHAEISRRTFKDFDVVDGEEQCAGASDSTRRAVLNASVVPPRLRVESPAHGAIPESTDPSSADEQVGRDVQEIAQRPDLLDGKPPLAGEELRDAGLSPHHVVEIRARQAALLEHERHDALR